MAEPDASAFVERASEVSRLIEGLKDGSLSPEYVDTKIKARDDFKQLPRSNRPQKDAGSELDEHRRAELQRKAQDIKADYERRLVARKKYDEYVARRGVQKYATDYTQWSLWCPEDETDELISSLASSNPALRSMELEIDQRHHRCGRGWRPRQPAGCFC
jgi:5'-3' exonuclease